MTAYLIQKYANFSYHLTLLEASERLGGKILTPRFDTVSATYEAGAAELYDYTPVDEDPLRELVEELGLLTTRMEGGGVLLGDDLLANQEDIRDQLGPEVADRLYRFDRQAHDLQTPREFYLSDHTLPSDAELVSRPFEPFLNGLGDPRAIHYLSAFIHSDLATEPSKTNLEYGLQNYLMNNPRYMRLYSIDGGNEQLPRALVARLRADIRLRHRVTAIQRTPTGRMRVTMDTPEGRSVLEFDTLIVALPFGYLPEIDWPDARLATAMRRHLQHYNHPAHYLRITILFQKPFWRQRMTESYCMIDRFGGCCLYDESRRSPGRSEAILGWLIAGDAAEAMAEWDDDRLVDAALESLPASFGSGREYFREAKIHRWMGAVSAMPGGNSPISLDRRHQPEPEQHPNLLMVGDYLFDSTLNGVLDSADYVAQWVVSRRNEQSAS
jgi:monoamine oxidase